MDRRTHGSWVQLSQAVLRARHATRPDGFVFPSEKITTPLSLDNLWRRCMLPELGNIGLGRATFQRTKKNQRKPLKEARRGSQGRLRPEGPRHRGQYGSLHEFGYGAEARRSEST